MNIGGNIMFIDNIDMICELQMKITNQNALQPINYIKHSSLHLTFLSENVLFGILDGRLQSVCLVRL